MGGRSVVSNSPEEDAEGPTVQWEDEMEPELGGVWGEGIDRANIDDRTDWGRGNLSFSGSPESKNSQPP